jgi:hypothetical protein
MVQTPQQMSDFAINSEKVDPQTDLNPQTLAADQVAGANQARLQYPIGVDEAAIMSGSILGVHWAVRLLALPARPGPGTRVKPLQQAP